jgi:hypothetical protein
MNKYNLFLVSLAIVAAISIMLVTGALRAPIVDLTFEVAVGDDAPSAVSAVNDARSPVAASGGETLVMGGGLSSLSSRATIALASTPDEWLPTPLGLYDLTTAQYAQEGFQDLTTDEARALLPLDDYDLPRAQSLSTLLGGFPTIEDCEQALRRESVLPRFREFALLNLEVSDMEAVPAFKRNAAFKVGLDIIRAHRDTSALLLMEELDRRTSYKHWTLLWRLFKEWER